jgi:hypothetical protein
MTRRPRRTIDAAAENSQKIRDRDDAPEALAIDHRHASDRPAAHQVGDLSNRLVGCHRDDRVRHQILDTGLGAHAAALSTAGVSVGDNTDDLRVVHHDQVMDAVTPHLLPRVRHTRLRSNRLHFFCHDFRNAHVPLQVQFIARAG